MSKVTLLTVVDKLQKNGHELDDETVAVLEKTNDALEKQYGDIALEIAAIRSYLMVFQGLLKVKGDILVKLGEKIPEREGLAGVEKEQIELQLVKGKHGRSYQSGRLVCSDLRDVVQAGVEVFDTFGGELLDFKNYHAKRLIEEGVERFYFGYNAYLFDPNNPFELQILTERAAAVGELNHPILRRPTVRFGKKKLKYVKALTWGAHLLDHEDYDKQSFKFQ